MEEVPEYKVRQHSEDGCKPVSSGKTYYLGGTPWPMPGDSILVGQTPSVVPPEQFDIINKPKHYMLVDGVEVRDICKALAERMQDKYSAFFISDYIQFLQYVLRFDQKNGIEDLKKAKWYLEKLLENKDKE